MCTIFTMLDRASRERPVREVANVRSPLRGGERQLHSLLCLESGKRREEGEEEDVVLCRLLKNQE